MCVCVFIYFFKFCFAVTSHTVFRCMLYNAYIYRKFVAVRGRNFLVGDRSLAIPVIETRGNPASTNIQPVSHSLLQTISLFFFLLFFLFFIFTYVFFDVICQLLFFFFSFLFLFLRHEIRFPLTLDASKSTVHQAIYICMNVCMEKYIHSHERIAQTNRILIRMLRHCGPNARHIYLFFYEHLYTIVNPFSSSTFHSQFV